MNLDQAKRIPLSAILAKLGFVSNTQTDTQAWYHSPFREEKTPSFHVHTARNVWYDFGAGKGGSVIELAQEYLTIYGKPAGVSEALAWLEQTIGNPDGLLTSLPARTYPVPEEPPKLLLRSTSAVSHPALIALLGERGIPLEVARRYLKQARIYNRNSKKVFYALALPNEEEGFEIRNRSFKGSLVAKDISYLRGSACPATSIHVFEGMMDFLSIAARYGERLAKEDVIVLNSVSLVAEVPPYLKGFGYTKLHTWLDNDTAGDRATAALAAFCEQEEGLTHVPMNALYRDFKDVNDWYMAQSAAPKVQP